MIAVEEEEEEEEGEAVPGSCQNAQNSQWEESWLTNPPGHLKRDKWTALSGPLSQVQHGGRTMDTRRFERASQLRMPPCIPA